jgi:hypothetical protein
MFRVIIFLSMFAFGQTCFSQAFAIDTTFSLNVNLRTQTNISITDILEVNSLLYVSGNFDIRNGSSRYRSLVYFNNNGDVQGNYPSIGASTSSFRKLFRYDFNEIYVGSNGMGIIIDSLGQFNYPVPNWKLNALKTVQCSQGAPYFYPDGSSIFPNGFSQTANGPCPIINLPDTFPGMYLVKVTPQGLWDSTFRAFPNHPPLGVIRYDSNRLLVYGLTSRFTHYNGMRVNGLCRIFADGSLDTTFQSPSVDTLAIQIVPVPKLVDSSGKIFITGTFMLNDTTAKKSTLARLNPDGSIDHSFQNFWGANYTPYSDGTFIETIVSTTDNGYLVGGTFDQYQGVSKNSIVKLDFNGRLETQYFTGTGPDSSQGSATSARVIKILKSKFGGYYVAGNFLKWDGQTSQPIIRIHGLNTTVGLEPRAESRGAQHDKVKTYPNPSNGIVTIESAEEIELVELFGLSGLRYNFFVTLSGAEMRQKRSLDLSNLSKGVYFLKIELENGKVVTKKVVKQ